jgi:hypothetical protein
MGGNASPERGVASDEGIEEFIILDRLLDRLREKLKDGVAGEPTADWLVMGKGPAMGIWGCLIVVSLRKRLVGPVGSRVGVTIDR